MFSRLKNQIRSNPHIAKVISYSQKDKKNLIIVLLLILAIPLVVAVALTQQETRQRASGIVLSRIEVSPGEITTRVNGSNVAMSALAYDESNNPVFSGVSYEWSMSSTNSVATLTLTSGDITQLDPLSVGYGEITVIARLGSQNITKGISVRIANPDGSIPPPPPFVRIVSPNGGETLTQGDKVQIIWEGKNIDKCSIGYSFGEGSLNHINTNVSTSGNGSYEWTVNVGNIISPRQVKISMLCYQTGVGSKSDQSDNFFTVNPLPKPTPTPIPAPSKPGPLKVVKVTDTTEPNVKYVDVDWPDTPNADFYNVYFSDNTVYPTQFIFLGKVTQSTFQFKVNKDLYYSTYVDAVGVTPPASSSDVLKFRACDFTACTYTFNPTADSYVDNSTKNTKVKNYGGSDLLKVGKNTAKISFIKFDLASIKGKVSNAKLRLYVQQGNKAAVVIRNVPDNTWTELGITYKNQPGNDKTIAGGFENPKSNQWVEVDIASYLSSKAGQTVSMNLRSNGDNEVTIKSKNSNLSPQLILTVQP